MISVHFAHSVSLGEDRSIFSFAIFSFFIGMNNHHSIKETDHDFKMNTQ